MQEILRCGHAVTRRVAFLRAVSRALLAGVPGASAVELELADGPLRYLWRAERAGPERLVPAPGDVERRADDLPVAATFPITREDGGTLRLFFAPADLPVDIDRATLARVADTLGIAIANRRATAALAERVKELTCLYAIARISEDLALDAADALRAIVARLPPAWQYPELTIGRVVLDGHAYATADDADEAPHVMRAPLLVGGEERGVVEVFYRAPDDPQHDLVVLGDDVFLTEEHALIRGVSREIGRNLEVRQARLERERLLEQVARADRLAAIGQLAAGVAHELNEPLGGILGFAELALAADVGPTARPDVRRIVDIALHARGIIKQLLLFARQSSVERVPVDLRTVVAETLTFLETRCARQRVELVQDLAPVPTVAGNPGQLKQVLVNLVVNALHAMPDGGTLTVRCRPDGDAVALEVADTGVGMPPEVAAQVFDPFFTTRDIGEGTGLGLSVSHGIIVAHGGTIEVRSEPGRGASFSVRLPVAPAEEGEDGP
ncbi:MAG: PAS domain-containing sensor histidine kinase [Deltaproteobacteria bacterium]|nr:MAG: PAS domain-containing sensor histidine kinase [Deltaproteobacteria bacterium]